MAVEPQQAADPAAVREDWIEARVAEFADDPAVRDRAIATILYDSLMLGEQFRTIAETVKKEGLGGMIKGLMGALNSGR